MRITKQSLVNRWAITTILAIGLFAILAVLDLRLETLSGFGTSDLQSFYSATQYNAAFMVWPSRYAARAGFNWGLDYLLIPLYAMSFFYSGIIAREALPPASRLRRMITLLAAVPVAGALLDALENALQFFMLLSGASDTLANTAYTLSHAKTMALMIGILLLFGAVLARVQERKLARLKGSPPRA